MSTDYRRACGLDGLRAVAVAVVVLNHVRPKWLPGGFLGVDLFFVISGYLITSLLSADHWRTGRIRLGVFWKRRALRLLPALWLVLAVTACAATLVGGDAQDGLRGAVTAALTYRSNWWQLEQHDLYFADLGPVPYLRHLWSLAVEEQFYLGWPLLLWAVMAVFRRQRRQAACAAVLAALSFTAMGLWYAPGADSSRVYYGTDTHGGGLLLGAAVALVLPLTRAGTLRRPEYVRAIDAAGVGGLVVLAAAAVFADGAGAFVYRGGLVLVCLSAVAVTVAACGPGRLGRSLAWQPLEWLGRRSYGIYLWHWPVLACVANSAPASGGSVPVLLVELAVPVALAAVSYRVLEEPLLRLGPRAYAERVSAGLRRHGARRPRLVLGGALAGAGMVGLAVFGVTHAPERGGLQEQIAAGERAAAAPSGSPARSSPTSDVPASDIPVSDIPVSDVPASGGSGASAVSRTTASAPQPVRVPPPVAGGDITALGDSVMLASAPALRERFPGIGIDAVVGRQMSTAPKLLRRLRDAGRLRRVVVVGLGTNGEFDRDTFERVLAVAGRRRTVAFVNVHAPRSWERTVNTALASGVAAHRRTAVLVEWNATASRHPDLLWDDRIHPRPTGGRLYAEALAGALAAHSAPGTPGTVGTPGTAGTSGPTEAPDSAGTS